jgi:hypothetical protein
MRGGTAKLVQLTFAQPFPNAPNSVVLTPANANAAALSGAGAVYIDPASSWLTSASFTMRPGATALVANTVYEWFYQVIG